MNGENDPKFKNDKKTKKNKKQNEENVSVFYLRWVPFFLTFWSFQIINTTNKFSQLGLEEEEA